MANILDPELDEGLTKAKERPLNFALICKGPKPLKMFVRKKRIKENELLQAKQEAKGNEIIQGVVHRQGAALVLQVVGTDEPGLKIAKIREFLAEQVDFRFKPQWQMVAVLDDVLDDDDAPDPNASPSGPSQYINMAKAEPRHYTSMTKKDELANGGPAAPAPIVLQPAGALGSPRAQQVWQALNDVLPKIHQATAMRPQYDGQFRDLVAAIQADLNKDRCDQATSRLRELVTLIATVKKDRGAVRGEDQTDRMVTLQVSRVDWEKARKQLQAQIQRVAKAVTEECADPDEYDQSQVARQLQQIDRLMDRFDSRLIDVLDQALNATDQAARGNFEKQAASVIAEYVATLNKDKMIRQIDHSGLLDVSIRKSIGSVLAELTRRIS